MGKLIRFKNRLRDPYLAAFVVVLLAYILFKLRFLDLPFYWDEAWVYAPAIRSMFENGLGLQPDALSPSLSRGHPVLFPFLAAAWMHLFGPSRSSLHAFALFVSVAVLVATYILGSRIGRRELGLGASLITVVNETFLAQGGILLPEMLLTFWVLLALIAFLARNSWGYLITALCAVMTKESGVVLVLALTIWQVLITALERTPNGRRQALRWVFIAVVPGGLGTLYFVWQHALFGWYFFPEHIGLITWSMEDVLYKARVIFTALFEDQGLVVITYAYAIVAPLVSRRMSIRWSAAVVFLHIAAIKALWGRWTIPAVPSLVLCIVCLVALLFVLHLPSYRKYGESGRTSSIGFLFIVGIWGFSALNFYTDRYLLCAIPVLALGMLAFVHESFVTRSKVLYPAVVILCAGSIFMHQGKSGHIGDTKLAYADDIAVNRQMIKLSEELGLQNKVFYGSFMVKVYMTDVQAGYLNHPAIFLNVSDTIGAETTHALITHGSPPDLVNRLQGLGFRRLARTDSGPAWAELHERNIPSGAVTAPMNRTRLSNETYHNAGEGITAVRSTGPNANTERSPMK